MCVQHICGKLIVRICKQMLRSGGDPAPAGHSRGGARTTVHCYALRPRLVALTLQEEAKEVGQRADVGWANTIGRVKMMRCVFDVGMMGRIIPTTNELVAGSEPVVRVLVKNVIEPNLVEMEPRAINQKDSRSELLDAPALTMFVAEDGSNKVGVALQVRAHQGSVR